MNKEAWLCIKIKTFVDCLFIFLIKKPKNTQKQGSQKLILSDVDPKCWILSLFGGVFEGNALEKKHLSL